MNPWIIISLVLAVAIFGVDFLLRRKKWKDNSKEEKVSLLLNMCTCGPYVFLSVLGMLWGIVSYEPKSAFGQFVYDATLVMGFYYFILAIVAVIASLILRKLGKVKMSTWVNIIALIYIVVVFLVNYISGAMFLL